MVLRSRLEKRHPAVLFFYFCAILVLIVGCRHIGLLLLLLFGALAYECVLFGITSLRGKGRWLFLLFVVTTVGNGFLSHNGVSVLFYLNDLPVTKEAFAFGAYLGLLLGCAYLWFDLFQAVCDKEKILFLFGRIWPGFGVMISMTLHYIPLLQKRYAVIRQAQEGMGRTRKGGWVSAIRQIGKEYSILISWSLENSIETSDLMTARGYGSHRRSLFHRFYWNVLDTVFLLALLVLFVCGCIATYGSSYHSFFYPYLFMAPLQGSFLWLAIAEGVLAFLPALLEIGNHRVRNQSV